MRTCRKCNLPLPPSAESPYCAICHASIRRKETKEMAQPKLTQQDRKFLKMIRVKWID